MTDLVAQLVGALEGAYSLAIGHAATYKFQHELEDVHPTHQKVLDDATAALSAAKDGGWVSIDQAPRAPVCQDGNNHYSEYILAWWPGAMAPTRCRWWFRDDSGACNFIADGSYAVFPTKWQPLPNPPKEQNT